jgi:vacuolar-type H+-ATPase subunit H
VKSPLAAVRAAEQEATAMVAAAETEADEVVAQAKRAARGLLARTRAAMEQEYSARLARSRADADAEAARIEKREVPARDPPDGLVDAMLASVLPEGD